MAVHPGGIKNSFTSQAVFWLFFLPLLTLIFLPLLSSDTNIEQAELDMIAKSGTDIAAVTLATQDQFRRWFIDTGVMDASTRFFGGQTPGYSSGPNLALVDQASSLASGWVMNVWALLYKCMWRLHALFWIYVAAIGAVCLPCLWDGIWVRARKRYNFQTHNPLVFNMSTHLAVMVVGLLVYIPLIPVTLTPVVIAGFIAFLGASLWWAAANFQTGV